MYFKNPPNDCKMMLRIHYLYQLKLQKFQCIGKLGLRPYKGAISIGVVTANLTFFLVMKVFLKDVMKESQFLLSRPH